MGREGPFFCHFSALSGPGVSGWKGWRYSPRCAEAWFSEVGLLLYGVLSLSFKRGRSSENCENEHVTGSGPLGLLRRPF